MSNLDSLNLEMFKLCQESIKQPYRKLVFNALYKRLQTKDLLHAFRARMTLETCARTFKLTKCYVALSIK